MQLLIGTDSAYSAVIRAAHEMHRADASSSLLVLLGGVDSFSFKPRPSTILVPGMPAGVIAAVPALEEFGIASRLASEAGLPGCHDGTVLELMEQWLAAIEPCVRAETNIVAAGSEDFLQSVETVSRRHGLPMCTIRN